MRISSKASVMAEPRYVPRKMSAGVILVDRRGRVLMQLRDDDPNIMFPAHWGITGGASHADETPEQTARREVAEETGLTLGRIEPFRAYYFNEKRTAAGRRAPASSASADFELYLFHAPCETPVEEMTCGEGRALRFFGSTDLDAVDVAYNHREVLDDFFAAPAYARYLRGDAFEDAANAVDPIQHFRTSLDAGEPWFDALMQAIALWQQPEEQVGARHFRYLIGGEAFDWLLLAERLLSDATVSVPDNEAERLLFEARFPEAPPDLGPDRLADDALRDRIGETKYRAHLNYVYGVIVEEALQYAVELDLAKERVSVAIKDPRDVEHAVDPLYERIYGRPRGELLAEFRAERNKRPTTTIALTELREFFYWLFKYRVKNAEPARVASDTRKALAQLSAIEDASKRARARRLATRTPEEIFATAD
jgi:8-oxo-dGTP pyrophosphatase MutT (NUDIX family)